MITNASVKWENPHGSFSLELEKLSLSADKGQKIPVMGRTGAGKSTLLSLMAGLKWPEAGKVIWTFPDNEKVEWSHAQPPSVETREQIMNVLNNWLTKKDKDGNSKEKMLVWVTHHHNDPQLYDAEYFLCVKYQDKNPHKATCGWEKT
jgi:ATPase subunit of ABC transporter with duplicated ATPase domains